MLQNIKWRLLVYLILLCMWFCECKVITLSRTLLVYLLVVRLLRLFWCLPLIPLTFSPNPPPPLLLLLLLAPAAPLGNIFQVGIRAPFGIN